MLLGGGDKGFDILHRNVGLNNVGRCNHVAAASTQNADLLGYIGFDLCWGACLLYTSDAADE